jgi:chromosome segregation ATPase
MVVWFTKAEMDKVLGAPIPEGPPAPDWKAKLEAEQSAHHSTIVGYERKVRELENNIERFADRTIPRVVDLDAARNEKKSLQAQIDELQGELRVLSGLWAQTIVSLQNQIDGLKHWSIEDGQFQP